MSRIRVALRSLARAPLLSLVVVASLALGIGANTAIFSLFHQILLRSLPIEKPEQLVLLTSNGDKSGSVSMGKAGGGEFIFSCPTFRELEKNHPGVAGVAAFGREGANLAFRNQTKSASVLMVSGGYFPLLGVRAMLGRTLTPEDDLSGGGNPVAVLGYQYWHDRLGGQLDALNQPLRINSVAFTIVGIAPRGFSGTTFGEEPAAYVPMSLQTALSPGFKPDRVNDYWIYLLARLLPGVTRTQATAALNVPYSAIMAEQSKTAHGEESRRRIRESRLTLVDGSQGHSGTRTASQTPLLVLQCATLLVLLIATANAANLLLARSAQRRREIAIRVAMGAGRAAIVGQSLTEALLLALAGGAAGILIGGATLGLLLSQTETLLPPGALTARLEWPVLAFSLALTLAAGLLFGLYPAWEAARTSVATSLKDESGQSSPSRSTARVRWLLVCAQVTISAVLLIPTGLFLKSLVNLFHVDLGIRTENVIGFGISPQLNGYLPAQSRALFERLENDLAAIPGVRTVATCEVPLIGGDNYMSTLTVEGYTRKGDTNSSFNAIGVGFFGKMGAPLIAGREFNEHDTAAGPKVAIVNQQFARYFFGNQNPIGRKFTVGWGNVTPDTEIVGVVKDSRYSDVRETPPRVYYIPWRQQQLGFLRFYVRSALPPERVTPQIRRALAALDHDLPAEDLRTLDETIRLDLLSDTLVLQIAGTFAALATALAMLGLYGVMAHSVARRSREFGIRLALGAAPARIRAMVLREMLTILAIGLVTGVPAALVLARFTASMLYGVKAHDALVVAGAVLALGVSALAAAYIPARRASRVNPIEALRYE